MHRMIMRRIKRAHNPFYNIIVTPGPQKYIPGLKQQTKKYRPSKQLEILGQWDPIARETPQAHHTDFAQKQPNSEPSISLLDPPSPLVARLERRLEWNRERVLYWLEQGAEPSPLVRKFLIMDGILPQSTQSQPQPSSENKSS